MLKPSEKSAPTVTASKSTGIQYNADLQRILRQVRKEINEQLMPLLRKLQPFYQNDSLVSDSWINTVTAAIKRLKDRWTSEQFADIANKIASDFVDSADKVNASKYNFEINIFTDNVKLQEELELSTYENTELIKSVPAKYLAQVENIILYNIRSGNRSGFISRQLTEQFGVESRRAKMIARDQTAKINSDLNQVRATSAGFEYFQWLTSEDNRVRNRHRHISDKVTAYGEGIYRYDNPPLSDKGVPILPGKDYLCRCVAKPIPAKQVEKNQKEGHVEKGVYR